MTKTFTADDFLELINRLDDILKKDGGENKAEEVNADETSSEEITQAVRDAFEDEFSKKTIQRVFCEAVAAVMTISSLTGLDLDKTLELFAEKMRDEINSESTKAIMELGDNIIELLSLLA